LNLEGGVKKKKINKMVLRREGQKMGLGKYGVIYDGSVCDWAIMENSIRNGGKMGLYIDTYSL
jgi:hypothetical protein